MIFFDESSLPGDHSIASETSTKASRVISSCTSDLISLNNSNSSSKGHLNINSIWNKFDGLKFVIDNKIDIYLISETKLDDTYPTAQFLIEGFSTPYRHDRNSKCGGLFLYIRKDITSKRMSMTFKLWQLKKKKVSEKKEKVVFEWLLQS